MARPAILQSRQSYTFGQYFEMTYEPEDILAEFGYTLERAILTLPQSTADLDRLDDLKTRIQESLPYISLTSEAARRELSILHSLTKVLIYPILIDIKGPRKGCQSFLKARFRTSALFFPAVRRRRPGDVQGYGLWFQPPSPYGIGHSHGDGATGLYGHLEDPVGRP